MTVALNRDHINFLKGFFIKFQTAIISYKDFDLGSIFVQIKNENDIYMYFNQRWPEICTREKAIGIFFLRYSKF